MKTAVEELRDELARAQAEGRELKARLAIAEGERDRLQRACDEGLPREVILCPACGQKHLEWFRHDAPGIDGRKRPHHTHRCYHCEHVWDSERWSFGVEVSTGIAAERDEARARATAAEAEVARLDALAATACDERRAAEAERDALRVPLHRLLWCVETWEGGIDTDAELRALVPKGSVAEPAPSAEGGDRG